ncbi:MAG: DUF6519 domain-containing protein [Nitrospirales bacterium]|nr:DUF6519 domain-containing protein [Nitrospirales bacterium]
MKGDFSRNTFDPGKHFSRVLLQQGRVQLDADSNEQTAILLHYLRTLAADLIGPSAGPAGSDGFKIKSSIENNDFHIGPGRYYVDGILCENEIDINYTQQKDYPDPLPLNLGGNDPYLVYLDVWERHITALENDYIREKALGGPDTATRTQVVWQVKVDHGVDPPSILEPTAQSVKAVQSQWADWVKRWHPPHRGCLRARVNRPEDSKDPCLTDPDAKYRGQENQLYRIEIHQGGLAGEEGATFKWSRDNGAVVSLVKWSGLDLIAEKPLGFVAGNWVELSNDEQELRGQPGKLVKVLKVEGDRFTLESTISTPADIPEGEVWPTKARRWDQEKSISLALVEGIVPLSESKTEWIDLENGIQIQFLPSSDETNKHIYRTGDYWLIPARVATGNIEWPLALDEEGKLWLDDGKEIPMPQAPLGIWHHYAPLAILGASSLKDCRCQIPPLNSCKMLSLGEEGMGEHPKCELPNPLS